MQMTASFEFLHILVRIISPSLYAIKFYYQVKHVIHKYVPLISVDH